MPDAPEIVGEFEARVNKNRVFVHPDNPRKGNLAIIKESILKHGFYDALKVQRSTGYILAGNHRYKAGVELGMTEFPVIWLDATEEEASALLLVDNKTSDEGEYDKVALEAILSAYKSRTGTIAGTGYTDKELDKLIREVSRGKGKDAVPEAQMDRADELQAKWKVKPGDIWTAGDHRIGCGDVLDDKFRSMLLDGGEASLVVTDPPWNVNYGATKHPTWKQRSIQNDNLGAEFKPWMTKVAEVYANAMKPGALIYMFMSAQEWGTLMDIMRPAFHWSSTIIWAKDQLVLSRKDYHTQYEPFYYGWKNGAPRLVVVEDRSVSDVWFFDRPNRSEEHPTMKPVELFQKAIKLSSTPGDLVLDFFSGSGTCCVACQLEERKCVCMDIEPKYVSVLLERLTDMGLECVLSYECPPKAESLTQS